MDHLTEFLTVAKTFMEGHGLTIHQASKRLFDNTRKLSYLKRSRNAEELDPRMARNLIQTMSRSWPAGTDWPENVVRPAR